MTLAGIVRLATLAMLAVPALAVMVLSAAPADARGWGSVHRTVKPSGNCSGAQEILAGHYASGKRTRVAHTSFVPHRTHDLSAG